MRRVLLCGMLACGCGRLGFDAGSNGAVVGPGTPQTVQHVSGYDPSDTIKTVTMPQDVTAGDVLIVAISTGVSATLNAPTDSLASAYTLAASVTGTGNDARAAIYVAIAPASGLNNVTCSINILGNIHCHIYEVHDMTDSVDVQHTLVSNTTTPSISTSGPTTQPDDYVVAYFAGNNSKGPMSGDARYGDVETTISESNDVAFSEVNVLAAPGVASASATSGELDDFASIIVAFKKL